MSNLTELVPPLELCKLIPAGKFAETALVWIDHRDVYPEENANPSVVVRKIAWAATSKKGVCPAPTLQEIMENMTTLCVTPEIFHAHKNYWTAQGEVLNHDGMYKFHHGCSSNPATAALRLWLKLKGIEYEQKQS